MTELEIYKASICWYGKSNKPDRGAVQGPRAASEHICANPEAQLYDVVSVSFNGPKGQSVRMWLCPKHLKSMERRKFKVTKAVLL